MSSYLGTLKMYLPSFDAEPEPLRTYFWKQLFS
jgi:hypothetical protein